MTFSVSSSGLRIAGYRYFGSGHMESYPDPIRGFGCSRSLERTDGGLGLATMRLLSGFVCEWVGVGSGGERDEAVEDGG